MTASQELPFSINAMLLVNYVLSNCKGIRTANHSGHCARIIAMVMSLCFKDVLFIFLKAVEPEPEPEEKPQAPPVNGRKGKCSMQCYILNFLSGPCWRQ